MTPRALTLLLRAPERIPDADVAAGVTRLLRALAWSSVPSEPSVAETLEIGCQTIDEREDAFMRRVLRGEL